MNNNGKESENKIIPEKEIIEQTNKIEKEIDKEKDLTIINDNINIDELWNKNSKYKLKYTELLQNIKKGYCQSRDEFLCNMILMPQKIELSDKISTLNCLSNFYKKKEEIDLLYSITIKLEKYLNSLMAVEPSLIVNVFVRAMESLQVQGNYIYTYKYLMKTKKILEKNAIIVKQKYNIDSFEKFCGNINNDYLKNVILYKKKFIDKESLKDEVIHQVKNITDLLIDGKYELDEKEYLYVINKKWVLKTKSFIENYIRAKKENIKDFFEESFEPQYIYESYFDIQNEKAKDKDKNKQKLFSAFPSLINNFEITAFKDYWNDSNNLDENCFIKKGKKLDEDYYLINEKDWKILSDIFGSTNEIKRRKDNLDLLELKFILFDRRICNNNGNIHLLKQKYILINKNLNFKELKQKLIRVSKEVINSEIEKDKNENKEKKKENKNKEKIDTMEKKENKEQNQKERKNDDEDKEKIINKNNLKNDSIEKIKNIDKEENKEEKKIIGEQNEKNTNINKEQLKENNDNKIEDHQGNKPENKAENSNEDKENIETNQKGKDEEKKDIKEGNIEEIKENKLENKENNKENQNKEKIETKKQLNMLFYILDKDKKDLLIELTYSFESSFSEYYSIFINEIPKEEVEDNKPLTNLLNIYKKEKHLLIIELFLNNDVRFLYDLKKIMKSQFICRTCSKPIENLKQRYKCDICNFSLFCSKECSNNSRQHVILNSLLSEIKNKKFVLSELLTTNLYDMLSGSSKYGKVGLGNMGNTCYMNSALQCLSNTEDLTKYFLFGSFKSEINNGSSLSSKGVISESYSDLIGTLWTTSRAFIVPKKFRINFCKKTRLFLNSDEQDSQEFLLALLDNLHEDLNRITNKKYLEMEEQRKGESDEEASKRWWNYHISRDNSIIVDLFQGQYKSTIRCLECKRTSVSYDTYMSIGLPIPTRNTQIQIKLLTQNLDFIDLNIKLDDDIQIKDIIKKATSFLDKNRYKEYLTNQRKYNKENIKEDKDVEVPINILYNNIEIIEFNDNFKMMNIYKTAFENINNNIKSKDNIKQPLFDNLKLSNLYKNNFNTEIILFEKSINFNSNNNINIYIYPITMKKSEGILSSTKDIILSYPIIFSIKMDKSLEELQSLIYEKFKPFLMLDKDKKKDLIEICFPHFIKNWGKFKFIDNICPICQKKYDSKKYCLLSNKKVLISDLIKKQTQQRPLILFAKSQNYKKYIEFYKGIPLFNGKSTANIKTSRNSLNIYDAFDLFNKEEYLEGDNQWYCNKCKKHCNAAKKIEIYKTPLYLIVQLKRFKHRNNIMRFILGNKNTTYIDYKEVLNLREFVVGPDKDKSIYNLYGITIHREFMNGGHYYAFCKNKGIWITFDDEKLTYCDNPVSKDAYLLFYKRKIMK